MSIIYLMLMKAAMCAWVHGCGWVSVCVGVGVGGWVWVGVGEGVSQLGMQDS